MAITQPGAKLVKHGEREEDDEGEESDEYEVVRATARGMPARC